MADITISLTKEEATNLLRDYETLIDTPSVRDDVASIVNKLKIALSQ